MAKRTLNLTEDERHRRSVSIRIRNAWAKEGKPGGEAELQRRKADPEVTAAIYKAQGWPLPDAVADPPPKKKPPRPKGAPKKGPPQPPAPPAKAKAPKKKAPPAPPAPPKKKPTSSGASAFSVLFPGLD